MAEQATPALMFMGTGSDVGKSLVVAGLCRAFANRGLRVRPFKPQNMSNNAAIAMDGGEIGRAQALQARACRVPTSHHMNPVLLKPESSTGSQVVVHGQVWGHAAGRDYQRLKGQFMPAVMQSFARLQGEADLVLVEGAGSASEVNLRSGDIANWGFAVESQMPVVLLGDIDRGGVIASLVGTCQVIGEAERALLKGFLINRFRGDTSLFDEGLAIIAAHTGMASLGIVPFFADAHKLPPEDSVALDQRAFDTHATGNSAQQRQRLKIAVPQIARIANYDDFDPLRAEPGVELCFVPPGEVLPVDSDLVILPGSKSTIGDLAFLRAQGWDIDLASHVRRGGRVWGICGGYQMLGDSIADPDGLEGAATQVPGLGYLAVDTVMDGDKTTTTAQGHSPLLDCPWQGYEIHLGRTSGRDCQRPVFSIEGRGMDGASRADGLVAGGYVHGLFHHDGFRAAFLKWAGGRAQASLNFDTLVDETLDGLAAHLEHHVDLDAVLALATSARC